MPVYCDGRVCGGSGGGSGSSETMTASLVNKTGAPSVIGTVIRAHTAISGAFDISPVGGDHAIGVVVEAGVADGSACRVAIGGRAQVLLQNGTASTAGNWVRTALGAAGRADATAAATPGFGATHFNEIGHCLETVGAGVDKLAWVALHFN